MEKENARKKIIDVLKGLDDQTLLVVYNEYAQHTNSEHIYYMAEFNNAFYYENAYDVATKIYYGDFCPNHDYFTFDGYANLKSIASWELSEYLEVYFSDIANSCINNSDEYSIEEIRAILDEYENDEN